MTSGSMRSVAELLKDVVDFESVPLRVVRPDYLAVIALSGKGQGLRPDLGIGRGGERHDRADRNAGREPRYGSGVAALHQEIHG